MRLVELKVLRGLILSFVFFWASTSVFGDVINARFLQILHTNDIHSYFDHAHLNPEQGGYASLKSLMDRLETQAFEQGGSTLRVDAGDFSEGNIFYMADSARQTFRLHSELGYDVAVLGNHDYLMGTTNLDLVLEEVRPEYNLVTANMSVDEQYTTLNQLLRPYHIYEINNQKVAFLGLTTDEFFYTWRLYNGSITDPIDAGVKFSRYLKEQKGVDYVVAVTHLGFKKDKELAASAPWLDLIIGGHSHTALERPYYVRSLNQKDIPIVQAGKHAENLGRLVIDVTHERFEIMNYDLVAVQGESSNRSIASMVDQANEQLNDLYGPNWLHEQIGFSELHPDNEKAQAIWSYFITDAMREVVDTDVAVHQYDMVGPNFPVGEISRRELLQGHPRIFDLEDYKGWRIYETTLRGVFVRSALKISMRFGLPLSITGVSYDWEERSNGGYKIKNLRINGRRINPFRRYTVAMPEGVVRGGRKISSFSEWILRHAQKSPHLIVEAMEEKLAKENGLITNDYVDRMDREDLRHKGFTRPRVMFPGRER